MARTRRRTPKRDWRPKFLRELAKHGLVVDAARATKVGRTTVYDERERNPEFAAKWKEIEAWTTEEMEAEARRRAVIGVEEPVYRNGEIVGHVRKFSDTLLIFMLKARKPEVYRENVKIEHGGTVTHEVETRLDREIEELMEELATSGEAAADAPAASGSVGANGANGAAPA